MEDIEFVKSRAADDEAIREFNRQRDHLEKQVAALKQQLAKSLGGSKNDIGKIMDVSDIRYTLHQELRHVWRVPQHPYPEEIFVPRLK